MTVALLRAVKRTLISAVTGTGASATHALPAMACVLSWQTAFDVAPAAINITIEVSIDGTVWTVVDTSTAVGGEERNIAATGALFVRANVNTNTGNRAVTVTMVAKPNP